MDQDLKFIQISPEIVELVWPEGNAISVIEEMYAVDIIAKKIWPNELLEISQTYFRLVIHFKHPVTKDQIKEKIVTRKAREHHSERKRKIWYIPVLYNGKDLKKVASLLKTSPDKIIQLHSSETYRLRFYGFLPGFMYLSGLPKQLFLPRKSVPDPTIKAGSVAIAGYQTGIYPIESPGGWHVIGQTPLKMFDRSAEKPVFAEPGDTICFKRIDKETYHQIESQIVNNTYQLTYEKT